MVVDGDALSDCDMVWLGKSVGERLALSTCDGVNDALIVLVDVPSIVIVSVAESLGDVVSIAVTVADSELNRVDEAEAGLVMVYRNVGLCDGVSEVFSVKVTDKVCDTDSKTD